MISLNKKHDVLEDIKKVNNITRIYSIIKLFISIMIFAFIICLISYDKYLLYTILSISSLIILILFSIFTKDSYIKLRNYKSLEYVYRRHENRRNDNYKTFSPDGKEFIDYNDYKTLDLDILGPKSLYQYICVAKTYSGRKKLANQLTNPIKKDIKFTNLVNTLTNDEEALKLEASINNIDSKNSYNEDEMLSVLNKNIKINKIGIIFMILSYVLLIASIILLSIFNGNPAYLIFFIPLNLFISFNFTKNDIFNTNPTKYSLVLNDYIKLIEDIKNINIVDDYYNEIKETLSKDLVNFKQLYKIFEMLSYRRNFIFSIIGNSLFFLNYIIIFMFNKRIKKINSIKESLNLINELEVMLSLAIIGMDNDVYTIPSNNEYIDVKGIYHPLVKDCVPNDFKLNGGIILTGSNMAGKTTFMRTLGINLVLMNAGGVVLAKVFKAPLLNIYTSLRTVDTVQEGISTFYAEINKMKTIMEKSDNNSLVLIDEIFKGTNAKDRIYSAFEIIKKLNEKKCNFIITTHDFELCEAKNILNYHFDEEYIENKIYFDYKIKDGKSNKTNAIYLLKMAGVI